MDGNEERKRLETEPVPDHIRPPRLSAGPSLTPFLTARASGEDGGEEERRKRQRSGQRKLRQVVRILGLEVILNGHEI